MCSSSAPVATCVCGMCVVYLVAAVRAAPHLSDAQDRRRSSFGHFSKRRPVGSLKLACVGISHLEFFLVILAGFPQAQRIIWRDLGHA